MNRHVSFCFLVYIVLALHCSNVLAQYQDQPSSDIDKVIYDNSLKLCKNTESNNIEGYKNAFRIALRAAKEVLTEFNLFSPNHELDNMLSNIWFHKALEECFPGDDFRKTVFVGHLYLLDLEGKVIGGVGLLNTLKYVSLGLEKLKTYGTMARRAVNIVNLTGVALMILPLGDLGGIYLINHRNENNKKAIQEIKVARGLMVIEEIDAAQFSLGVKISKTNNPQEILNLQEKIFKNESLRKKILNSF